MRYHPAQNAGGPLVLLSVLVGLLSSCCVFTGNCQEEAAMPLVPKPQIVSAEEWGSTPQPIADERRHTPSDIVVHHAGVDWAGGRDPIDFISGMQSWGQRDKDWPDLPYHFMIAPDGRIFEARDLAYEGETNTDYELAGQMLVELMGNFETQRPSPQQVVSLVHLSAWLCQEYGADPAAIRGHNDAAPGQTACPGRDLHRYISGGELQQWVAARVAGEIPEIVLGAPLPGGPTEMIPLD